MTGLREGARNLVTRGDSIGPRIEGLQQAADASRGRLDDALVDEAQAVADRAATRLRLSAQHTVVAIAGATGSGKSSTFNALTGLELSSVGVRRPTTSWATACVWGSDGADELLEWLGIPPRHQTMRDSMLDANKDAKAAGAFDGVVLLDLPDHDSTEVAHHLEVDRLVELADVLVWVLDPQKYADAAIHDRYLEPLQTHAGVMIVVLNHIDSVPMGRRQAMIDDVRRLLDRDGLHQVPLIAMSAREGIGVDELRKEIAGRVKAKKATKTRMEADLKATAEVLSEATGNGRTRTLSGQRVADLENAFAEAAGVPIVVDAVERSTRMRAGRATGWPVVAWFSKLKPDPLKRLHLDLGSAGKELTGTARTSLPATTPVQRARVDTEVRSLADDASDGLGRQWTEAIRRASTARLPALNDRLDKAVGSTDLGVEKMPAWAGLVRVLQWLLIVAALVGLAWLLLIAGGSFLGLPEMDTPKVGPLPLPSLLLIGGVLLGLLLALICRFLVAATARSRAAAADKRLRKAVHEVASELVVEPVENELKAYVTVRSALDRVLK